VSSKSGENAKKTSGPGAVYRGPSSLPEGYGSSNKISPGYSAALISRMARGRKVVVLSEKSARAKCGTFFQTRALKTIEK